jgi:hypothetical protein
VVAENVTAAMRKYVHILTHATKACGESYILNVVTCGQFHAPAALPQWKKLPVLII